MWAIEPEQLAGVLRRHADAPLLVDLDETLVLRSTTDAFIDAARPASLLAVALRIVDHVQPWRALPGRAMNRDWVRVLTVMVLTPWSLIRWRRSAGPWAMAHRNDELLQLVYGHRGPVVVVTRGFRSIVVPVVRGLSMPGADLVGCRLGRWRGQRHLSKSAMLACTPHGARVGEAVCVTDSLDDVDLLESVAVPLLVTWPTAEQIEPLADAYIPLRYIHETKPPRRAFIRVAWLNDDLYVTLLAYAVVAWWYPLRAIGLVLASMALWILYEAGYHENDLLGSTRESDPVLPDNFDEMRDAVDSVGPYVWAAAFTVAAAPFLVADSLTVGNVVTAAAMWAVVLAAVRGVFGLFNRLPKRHRVVPHLLLQAGKYLGFALVVPLAGPVGLALCLAQIAYRWFPYVQYRWMPSSPSEEPLALTRLAIFLALAVPSLVVVDRSVDQLLIFGLSLAFLARRAVPSLRRRIRVAT